MSLATRARAGTIRPAPRGASSAAGALLACARVTTTLADLPLVASGKVREMYDLGDRLLMVASDRISTYDVVHPTPIPDKGKVLTGLSVFWFEQTGDIVPNHLVSATEDVPDEVRGRALSVDEARHAARRVRRARLHHRLGLEGLPGDRRRRRDRAARGPARVRAAARADLHPVDEGRRRPRRDDRLRPRRRDRRRPRASWSSCATCRSRCTRSPPSTPRARGVILADTKFEFGRDADGVLRVGDEVLTPDSSRFWPADTYEVGRAAAELRQAVRARLGRGHRLGQEAARAGDPRRRRRRHARSATSRPTRRSPASRSTTGSRGSAP